MHREPIDPDVDLHVASQHAEARTHPLTLPAVALGGMAGASARHALEGLWPAGPGAFPWATSLINVGGCALIGVLMVSVQETTAAHPLTRPLLGVGVLGGFTTFSTYAVQGRGLVAADHPSTALLYLVGTAVAALLAVAAGLTSARLVAHRHRRRPQPETDPPEEPEVVGK